MRFLLSGTYQGKDRSGRYLLKLLSVDGVWKVDWIELTTAKATPSSVNGEEGQFVEYAVRAFLDLLVDSTRYEDFTNTFLLAATVTPRVRKSWGEPFPSDSQDGFDYNRKS